MAHYASVMDNTVTRIESIEAIPPDCGRKLRAVGVVTAGDLMEAASSRDGREDLARSTGIIATLLLEWVNLVELLRVIDAEEDYARLLEAAGVESVPDLAMCDPESLTDLLTVVNGEERIVFRAPELQVVTDWITRATDDLALDETASVDIPEAEA